MASPAIMLIFSDTRRPGASLAVLKSENASSHQDCCILVENQVPNFAGHGEERFTVISWERWEVVEFKWNDVRGMGTESWVCMTFDVTHTVTFISIGEGIRKTGERFLPYQDKNACSLLLNLRFAVPLLRSNTDRPTFFSLPFLIFFSSHHQFIYLAEVVLPSFAGISSCL